MPDVTGSSVLLAWAQLGTKSAKASALGLQTLLYKCERPPGLRPVAAMGDRYLPADGWAVEAFAVGHTGLQSWFRW